MELSMCALELVADAILGRGRERAAENADAVTRHAAMAALQALRFADACGFPSLEAQQMDLAADALCALADRASSASARSLSPLHG
jgi:hypothetical protein